MRWMSEGKRDREIATILGLSRRTVEKHVCHIFAKLKVETRTAAACECAILVSPERPCFSKLGGHGRKRKTKGNRNANPAPIIPKEIICEKS